ncbi:MAG: Trm112 family protein [Pirellulales bacterium]
MEFPVARESPMLTAETLAMLRCPETRQTLRSATPELIERLNSAVADGTLTNRAGQTVARPLNGGLLRSDERYLYPIIDRIPVLIADEAILVIDME